MADQPQIPLDPPPVNEPAPDQPERPRRERPALSHDEEKFVPAWCSYGLEGGLWLLMFLGVLGSDLFAPAAWAGALPVALGLVAAAWVAHLWYLREAAFFVSWPVALLGLAAAGLLYFVPPEGAPWVGGNPLIPLALLLVFIAVSCLLTELQVARLLVFCAAMAICACLWAMYINLPGQTGHLPGAPDIFQPAWFDSERGMGLVVLLALLMIVGFALWALASWMPTRNAFTAHSRVLSLSSPGFNLAIMGLAMGVMLMVPLYRLETVWLLPLAVLLVALLLILGTLRGLVAPWALGLGLAFLLFLSVGNLARPQGFWGGQRVAWLEANTAALLAGSEQRAWDLEAERFGEMVQEQQDPDLSLANAQLKLTRPEGPWHGVFTVAGNWGILLLLAFAVSLLVQCVRGILHPQPSVNALASLGLVGILTLMALFCLTSAFGHLGLVFLSTVLVAIAATRGEFDQEYQEE